MSCWATASLAASGGIQAKLEFIVGSQDVRAKLGLFGFVAAEGRLSAEIGAGVWTYAYHRRFGAEENHFGFGYELFALVGVGNNENLLGSTISEHQTGAIFRSNRPGDFAGLGLGVSRDRPFGSLEKFAVQRGHALMRIARNQHSWQLNFANDLRIGPFLGAAKDQGPTGSLQISYAEIDGRRLQKYGLGLDLFTPNPDYARPASNPQNSEDGAKRSWHTTSPWQDLFHANLYLQFSRQQDNLAWSTKLGVDSKKLGALVQNTIHDSFGLYPRYPWPVEESEQLYVEASAALF